MKKNDSIAVAWIQILVLTMICLQVAGAQASEQFKIWEQGERLTWEDFLGPTDWDNEHHAATYSGVQYALQYRKSSSIEMTFDVFSFFNRELSWRKPETANDIILEHEQVHFDIAELHARKFRKALAEYPFTENFNKEVKQLYAESNEARKAMQKKYDRDTNHSMNRDAQAHWQKQVEIWLNELVMYSDRSVRTRIRLK